MIFKSKTAKLFASCALSIFCICPTSSANEFENSYQPSQREACEMAASQDHIKLSKTCKTIQLFEPFLTSEISDDIQKVSLTKAKFPNWPFPDVYFENETELGFYIGDSGKHIVELEKDYELNSVAIGHIGNSIILQFKENLGGTHIWHKQMIFSPYSCEGYNDEIEYHLTSTLGWSQAFSGDIYKKTFFSPALCN